MNSLLNFMKIFRALIEIIGVVSSILGIVSFFATGETRQWFFDHFQATYNYIHPETPIGFVPLDPKFASVRLYPKYSDDVQRQAAPGLISKLQEVGVYAAAPDYDDIGLCKKYVVPTIIYHADYERDAAQTLAGVVTAAVSTFENQPHLTAAVEEHPEPTSRFTPFRFALCLSGLR